jgi:hypothetical protein
VKTVNTTLVLFTAVRIYGCFRYVEGKINESINRMNLLVHFVKIAVQNICHAFQCKILRAVRTKVYYPLHHIGGGLTCRQRQHS